MPSVYPFGRRTAKSRPQVDHPGGYSSGMPRLTLIVLTLLAAATSAAAQQQPTRTRNVVLIVADGVRWQEVFRGRG